MMSVGLLTYHFSDNYGALFQAYGLRQWFLSQGINARFINYHPLYVEEGGSFDRPLSPKLWRKNLTILYLKLIHLRQRIWGDRAQRASFEDFRAAYLGVRGPRRLDATALAEETADIDLLVCGSDQIWNPSIQKGLDPVYFLDFPAAAGKRKVSYAPSFGRSTLDPAYNQEAGRLISQLEAVSVREESGVGIVREASGREAIVVPDPTILLGRYDDLLPERTNASAGIFCYALRTDAVIRDVASVVNSLTGAPLTSVRTSRQRWRDIGTALRPGPVEWLGMIASARVVVSNSFHGIALSIVLNRPFIAVGLPGAKGGMNVRAIALLERCGLMDRFVTDAAPDTIRDLLKQDIDWLAVNARIKEQRDIGETFLWRALGREI